MPCSTSRRSGCGGQRARRSSSRTVQPGREQDRADARQDRGQARSRTAGRSRPCGPAAARRRARPRRARRRSRRGRRRRFTGRPARRVGVVVPPAVAVDGSGSSPRTTSSAPMPTSPSSVQPRRVAGRRGGLGEVDVEPVAARGRAPARGPRRSATSEDTHASSGTRTTAWPMPSSRSHVGRARGQVDVAQVDDQLAHAELVVRAQLLRRSPGGSWRSPTPPSTLDVGRGDDRQRQHEHERGHDQPARAAGEAGDDERDAGHDREDRERRAAAERGQHEHAGEAADRRDADQQRDHGARDEPRRVAARRRRRRRRATAARRSRSAARSGSAPARRRRTEDRG